MKREESPFRLQDADGGKPIVLNNCSCFWNDYRKKYVLIASEHPGRDDARRGLVQRGRPARGALGPRAEDHHARQQAGRRPRLLQPDAAPVPRPRGRAGDLPGRLVRQHLQRQPAPDPLLRVQPDHVPARPVRPAPEAARGPRAEVERIRGSGFRMRLVDPLVLPCPLPDATFPVTDERTDETHDLRPASKQRSGPIRCWTDGSSMAWPTFCFFRGSRSTSWLGTPAPSTSERMLSSACSATEARSRTVLLAAPPRL